MTRATLCRRAALAAAAGLLASISGAAGADTSGGPSFASGPPIPAGPDPVSVAVADFNGDGKRDLAVANRGYARGLKILLGNGAGGFAAAGSPLKAQGEPSAVASADFDGDGKADLALASSDPNTISVLLGDGAGRVSAAPGSPVEVTGNPLNLKVADLDGDGRADLIVSSYGEKQRWVTALLGVGSGRFVPAPGSPVVVNSRYGWSSLAVADFNGDGKPDLVGAGSGIARTDDPARRRHRTLGHLLDRSVRVRPDVARGRRLQRRRKAGSRSRQPVLKAGLAKPLLMILLGNGAAQFHAAAPLHARWERQKSGERGLQR